MLTVSLALTALAIAVVCGGALTAWLWWIRRRQLVVAGGIKALAAMRWREFSRFVVDSMRDQGFEAGRSAPGAHNAPSTDLRLVRGGEMWLLSCKQAVGSRVGPAMVDELASNMRIDNARGGILATLGRVESAARKNDHGIRLLDGRAVWRLVEPLCPASLREELAAQARAKTIRETGLAWLFALAFGFVAAMALGSLPTVDPTPPAALTPATRPATLPVAPAEPATPAVPQLSEEDQRQAVIDAVAALPGVQRASWVTRSTLLVNLSGGNSERLDAGICAALAQHAALRASRVQLQPPPGSEIPVRFMQCRMF